MPRQAAEGGQPREGSTLTARHVIGVQNHAADSVNVISSHKNNMGGKVHTAVQLSVFFITLKYTKNNNKKRTSRSSEGQGRSSWAACEQFRVGRRSGWTKVQGARSSGTGLATLASPANMCPSCEYNFYSSSSSRTAAIESRPVTCQRWTPPCPLSS